MEADMSLESSLHIGRKRGNGRRLFWVLVLVGGATLVLRALPGFGQEHWSRHDRRGHSVHDVRGLERRMERLLDDVEATEAQRADVKRILENASTERRALQTDGEQLHESLMHILAADSIDPSAVRALQGEAARLAGETIEQGVDVLVTVAEVLTPEQRQSILKHDR
jgi:Spy/CpxP family protein refolding chaperone